MIGRTFFSHKELMNKNCEKIVDMLDKKNIHLYDYEIGARRGRCCIKKHGSWTIDDEIPIFKGEGREYIEKLINFDNGDSK